MLTRIVPKPLCRQKSYHFATAASQTGGQIPEHTLNQNYDKNADRILRASHVEMGEKPTAFQRRMLVITGLYPSVKQVPEQVPAQTLNRMWDRERALIVLLTVFTFFSVYFYGEYSVYSRMKAKQQKDLEIQQASAHNH
ncbi:unnamed protein product [Bursaphelenchus okinawaensis]|uniref:Uncharacterized protein n=1 Tax=Bursaphelenchus okinawaensis TaxID=465554 RepID=A0A811KG41_9BILA|nr:unnamed protein product [Bursaphelenchus okinawaensis]CAG9102523.1 unnamed protein product [Bursaphelenchus okinawaensis]